MGTMKNSEKIWNLLQSPNTFEMGMELLETMVGIDPEIPYELFTQHSALEWFENHKNVRLHQYRTNHSNDQHRITAIMVT